MEAMKMAYKVSERRVCSFVMRDTEASSCVVVHRICTCIGDAAPGLLVLKVRERGSFPKECVSLGE